MKKLKFSLGVILVVGLQISSLPVFADGQSTISLSSTTGQKIKSFLIGCAYGTAIGAAAGTLSLAFSNDPGGNLQNIAKGASLGLYAGMAYGIVNMTMPTDAPIVALTPQMYEGKLSGAQVNYQAVQF